MCLAVTVLALVGCGDSTLSSKELQTQAEAVQSFAAEGALVAKGVEQARMTETFVRVHTDYLAKAARKAQKNGSVKTIRSSPSRPFAPLHPVRRDREMLRDEVIGGLALGRAGGTGE